MSGYKELGYVRKEFVGSTSALYFFIGGIKLNMIYVGIDIASDKHDYYMVHDSLTPFSRNSITIPNTISGFKKLQKDIVTFCGVMKDSKVSIGLESTGIYHKAILSYLINNGYKVTLINPILTNMDKKSRHVHNPKNDNIDSKAICTFLLNSKDLKSYTLTSYHTESLKSLSRERFKLVEEKRKIKQSIYNYIVRMFPEYLKLFSNIYQGSSFDILYKYPGVSLIERAHYKSIAKLLHGKCKVDAYTIKEYAKDSIGDRNKYLSILLKNSLDELKSINNRIDTITSKIQELVLSLNTKLLSIPGISYVTAGIILGEIGDIFRFKSAESLISYSGLDIEVYESGKFKATNKSISKKGSKYLRYALYQVARVIWINDPVFNEYYLKKKSEGKHYYVILGHIEKKIVRLIYSILKNNKEYTPQL